MSFHINAWLEQGVPQLQIIDADSKTVCMSWSYRSDDEIDTDIDRHEIQRLFRELLLLACKQKMANCRVYEDKLIHEI